MFIKKDTRKLNELLYDADDKREALKLSRREADFQGTTDVLCNPEHGPQLVNAKYLNLHNNKLHKLTQFSTLATFCSKLVEIDVSLNSLTELPGSMGRLPSLHTVMAEDNRLPAFPACLLACTHLRVLRLSGNAIASVPSGIAALRSLEELALDGQRGERPGDTPLTTLPDALCELASLRTLVLRGNGIAALPEGIGRLKALQVLAVNSNKLTGLPSSLGDCGALHTLLVNSNELVTLPASLARLAKLRKLNAGSNHLLYLPRALVAAWGAHMAPELVAAAPAMEAGYRRYVLGQQLHEEGSDSGGNGDGGSSQPGPAASPPGPQLELTLSPNPMLRYLQSASAPEGSAAPAAEARIVAGTLSAAVAPGATAAAAPTADHFAAAW